MYDDNPFTVYGGCDRGIVNTYLPYWCVVLCPVGIDNVEMILEWFDKFIFRLHLCKTNVGGKLVDDHNPLMCILNDINHVDLTYVD